MKRKKKNRLFEPVMWLLLFALVLFFEAFYIQSNNRMGKISYIPPVDTPSELMKGAELSQTFTCKRDTLEGLMFRADFAAAENPDLLTVVLKQEGRTVQTWYVSKYDGVDSYFRLVLDQPLEKVNGKNFQIEMKAAGNAGLYMNLSTGDGEGAGTLITNGALREDLSLCYGVIEKDTLPGSVFIKTAIYTAAAFAVLYLMLRPKWRLRPEIVFAVCYLLIGIFQFAAVPIFKTPDEANHFYRAYEISTGRLISKENPDGVSEGVQGAGRELPSALLFGGNYHWNDTKLYQIPEMMEYRIDKKDTQFIGFGNTALYAPGTYLPQAVGIWIVRIFTRRVLVLAYAARIFNWIVSGILLTLAIRYLPVGKNLAFLLAMLPMNMQQYSSISPDGFTFSMCMALTAFVLYQRYSRKEPMSREHLIMMYVLTFILCQCKVVYVPLCLLLFLIPWERFGDLKKYAAHIAGIAAAGGVTCLVWLKLSSRFLTEFQEGVDTTSQLDYILKAPMEFFMIMIRTFDQYGDSWIRSALGENLGWLNIRTSFTVLLIYGIVILIVLFLDNDIARVEFTPFVRGMLLGVPMLISLLICISLYMQWTAYHMPVIAGIQGRYFVPLLFPFFLAVKPKSVCIANKGIKSRLMYPAVVGMNLCISAVLLTYAL